MRTVIRYFFFFNDTATTEIYTLSLHDALPILSVRDHQHLVVLDRTARRIDERASTNRVGLRRQRPGERKTGQREQNSHVNTPRLSASDHSAWAESAQNRTGRRGPVASPRCKTGSHLGL